MGDSIGSSRPGAEPIRVNVGKRKKEKKKKPNPDLGNQEKRLQAVTNRREAWKKQKRISQKINKPSSVFKSWSSCSLVFFEFIRTREIGGMTLSNVQTKRSQSPMPAAVGNIRRRQASAQCPHTNVVSHLGKLGVGVGGGGRYMLLPRRVRYHTQQTSGKQG